jgi:hypothetical protein
MTDTKLWEISMITQSLNCLKSRYLSFFSSRGASRHAGMDVIRAVAAGKKCGGVRDLFVPETFSVGASFQWEAVFSGRQSKANKFLVKDSRMQ